MQMPGGKMISPGLWLAIPLVLGNLWHAAMPFIGRSKTQFKNSISENALRTKNVLLVHRFVHITLSICFLVYAGYLLQIGEILSATLLAIAASLDSMQVLTLSKKTIHTPMYFKDIHQITAWGMAAAYLLFSISLMSEKNVQGFITLLYLLYLVAIIGVSFYTKHKHFWFAQMGFFVSVSAVMAICALL